MPDRSFEGEPIDGTVQHLGEASYWQDKDGETVAVADDAPDGEATVENVPVPARGPDEPGQSTLDDWRWDG